MPPPETWSQRLRRLATRPAALAIAAALAAALVILPGLSTPGLWEPQEMKIADGAVGRRVLRHLDAEGAVRPGVLDEAARRRGTCPKEAADDDGARTLATQLATIGDAWLGSSEGDLRRLGALIGVLAALAAFGIGARVASPRAGLLGAVILLSFPMMVLQARQLTSELGTAAGATFVVYGLVAAARPARWPWAVLDLLVAAFAIGGGLVIAFLGGGALLGVVPPLGAVALAGGLGAPLAGAAWRLAGQLPFHVAGRTSRFGIGRWRPWRDAAGIHGRDAATAAVALLALVGTIVALWVLAAQVYDVQNRAPGTREIFGKSFVVTECWSEALGGLWRRGDDLRSNYHSVFEQAAFGMFPWSVLAPVALFGLALGEAGDRRRFGGRLLLAWAAIAWVTATVFQRKVGFTVYAGFPACAIAIGVWLDAYLEDRDRGPTGERGAGLLVGLWVLLGMITLAKDLQAFPGELTSLLVAGEAIEYPKTLTLLGVKLRAWLLVLAAAIALAFALGTWLHRPGGAPRPAARVLGRWGVPAAIALSLVLGVFWAQGWQRRLSAALSSKEVFATYRELGEGAPLGILGDMGNAPRYYARAPYERLASKDQLKEFLARDERVFALAPSSELCAIHRSFAGARYHVLDDTNAKSMLLSNQLGGAADRNPLPRLIRREPPDDVATPFRAEFDGRVELIGHTIPARAKLGDRVTFKLYFRVNKPVAGAWKVFVHLNGKGQFINLDHDPIHGRCATSFWQEGDYVIDEFTGELGDVTSSPGTYKIRIGFFTGTAPNWKNMKVTSAPEGAKDDGDGVTIGTITLQ